MKHREGGRLGNINRRKRNLIDQMPWRLPRNIDKPIEPLDQSGVESIHNGAMKILSDIGIEFLNPKALEIFKKAGCIINEQNVRIDKDLVMEMVDLAPSTWTITPRNKSKELIVGENFLLFGNVSSPPNYWDYGMNKKVSGTREQCQNLLKLSQYFNCIHFIGGYPVEPIDLHPSIRHLDVLYDKLTLTDKVCHAYSLGKERVEDVMEMVRIAGGHSYNEFESNPKMYTNINSTSPLKHDYPMIDGWIRLAKRNQGLIVTPFTLAGAMAPVTMAGAVAQSIAEALCVVVLAQLVRPGAPCAVGTFTSNVDMKTGAPAFGTPEYMRATQMTGQLCRFYNLPMRSSGVCAANVPDGQAMWETSNSLWAAVQSGTNLVYHAAGWLEGGLIASPEKFIMDCEVLQQIQRYMEPEVCATTVDAIALDTIKEVGNDGHFFGVQHTQDRYTTAFYQPFLSDWTNYEGWELGGGKWTAERAHLLFKEIVSDFEPPFLDNAIHDELIEFVERRKREGGAPTDF
ncbi:MAG: trimethylamine methyltransferase family protein [Paracoccaceae bacterium]|nr:trimethylamine methyltransferase family protein [Paracoccaceae bacterium]